MKSFPDSIQKCVLGDFPKPASSSQGQFTLGNKVSENSTQFETIYSEIAAFPRGGNRNPLQSSCAWEIPWTEEPAGLSPWGFKESDMAEQLSTSTQSQISQEKCLVPQDHPPLQSQLQGQFVMCACDEPTVTWRSQESQFRLPITSPGYSLCL